MNNIGLLILFLSLFTFPNMGLGLELNKLNKISKSCSLSEIENFKIEYYKLQNALVYEGKKVDYKDGKLAGSNDLTDDNNSPGKILEKALYRQYQNALTKVKNIYTFLNDGKANLEVSHKKIKENPDIVRFFMSIAPDSSTLGQNINLEVVLENLSKVNLPGSELTKEDLYLLRKLLIHSQDRICTLEMYNSRTNKSNSSKTQYLEQLNKAPLNKMIDSLKKINPTVELQNAYEDSAIFAAVQESLNKLKSIIDSNKSCAALLKTGSAKILNEEVQSCNLNHFIDSLSSPGFNQIEAILHFINANQKTTFAKSSLNGITDQFINDSIPTCFIDPNTKSIYIQNLPFKAGDKKKINEANFTCTIANKLAQGQACVQALNFEFVDERGFRVSSKVISGSTDKISNFSIKNSASSCSNLAIESLPSNNSSLTDSKNENVQPPITIPSLKTCSKDTCESLEIKDSSINWVKDDSSGKFSCFMTRLSDKQKTLICSEKTETIPPLDENNESLESCAKQNKILNPVDKKCVDKVTDQKPNQEFVETEASCSKKTETPKFDPKTKKCVKDLAAKKEDEASCNEKNEKWMKDENDGAFAKKWNWENGKCIDKMSTKPEQEKTENTEEKPEASQSSNQKSAPPRFQPISIPTRQIYILPGMP